MSSFLIFFSFTQSVQFYGVRATADYVQRDTLVIRNPHHFCGKECRARWRGLHYGFHVHPENCMKTVRKYDYDAIWQKHLETGYNARQLSELVFPDIPVPSIYAILVKMRKSSNR